MLFSVAQPVSRPSPPMSHSLSQQSLRIDPMNSEFIRRSKVISYDPIALDNSDHRAVNYLLICQTNRFSCMYIRGIEYLHLNRLPAKRRQNQRGTNRKLQTPNTIL